MMRKTLMTTGIVGVALFALVGCSSTASDATASSDSAGAADAHSDWPSEITLALIPNEQVNDLVTSAAPLTDYLSEQLGITVTGVVTKDYQAAVEAIGSGQAQIAIADAGSLAAAEDMYGAHAVLQDVRYGASSYASEFFTSIDNASKYCEDDPVEATYAATGQTFLYCNGVAEGDTNTGVGPVAVDELAKIAPGTKVAFGNTTSPAGYQLPVLALEEQGVNIDDLEQVPVTGNDNLIMAVYNGDAEVGFAYWDARSSIDASEVPDLGDKVVVFGLSEMYPNGGVVLSDDLPQDLRDQITDLMDNYSDVDPETLSNIFNQTDWVPADPAAIDLARQVNARFSE
ncbi:phosphate/phosphite/phosphonate ABC transporter substrate-binding protein [Demequina capsici]|uniref:Phosphate/phosphite/phosphonate ABC transporter substrate-binding protein n=1 Tax=Demequina capsici TaxID=3075620 RepID=A0AA96F8P9_9MICO|nr:MULTISPECIES: phosphate/phosphite/phosphonate ABC transporter substrate-binding protein [unclassified Demequina]WNM25492.1 phosphate/phosphite/phosphonate ABC transporter substrate-binding protein [Demequina sp. OYTSA14]WNM28383.1 phosphate/phosphite/phosphonate ABC transporter substrate-binding protein [Demequina sp. PMTSA13]